MKIKMEEMNTVLWLLLCLSAFQHIAVCLKRKVPQWEAGKVSEMRLIEFERGIEKGLVFVNFYMPGHGACEKLHPVWASLADRLSGYHDNIKIGRVRCAHEMELCEEYEVHGRGYPQLILYWDGEVVSYYSGQRSVDHLYQFVLSQWKSHSAGGSNTADNTREEL